jgi:hypothetical protein
MGGIGSGRRWHFGARNTVGDMLSLDVRRWAREGYLEPGRAFSWRWNRDGESVGTIDVRAELGRVVLSYRQRSGGDDWQRMEYPVILDTTLCHLGGFRHWFACPARGCSRRVAKLYGGAVFACRHCHRLAYPSQRENPADRAARRAEKIRARLGWEPGILNDTGMKPKGMHWRTFDRLERQHDAYSARSVSLMAERFCGGWPY